MSIIRHCNSDCVKLNKKKTIAIIGIQGLPNKYGGFETLADYLTKHLATEYNFIVYCSSKYYKDKLKVYNGAKLKYLPFNANGPQSILYDSISVILSLKSDRILILGSSAGFILPFLSMYKNKFILNIGGIDWQRSKWSKLAKYSLKLLEKLSIHNALRLISDNIGIQNYIKKNYNIDSVLIEYGGDQVSYVSPDDNDFKIYPFLKNRYAFAVARIQKDNNIEMILNGFLNTSFPIIFVGNWESSNYGKFVKRKYSKESNLLLLDSIYEERKINLLRSNCAVYIHGHSAGGTNPSLVEAMSLGLPIIAFSSGYNEYTTFNEAKYFKSSKDLKELVSNLSDMELKLLGKKMLSIATERYQWKSIVNKYSGVFNE